VPSATALGTTVGGTVVNSGAALQLQGGITIAGEALTLNGTGVNNDGALRNISGTNSFTGAITLGSLARINSDSGLLTIATVTGGFGLDIGGVGNTTVTGGITTGANNVTMDGSGTVTFSGGSTFTGNISVTGGKLVANEGSGATGVVGTSLGDADTAGRSVTVTNGTLVFAVANVTGGGSASAPANYPAFSLTNSALNLTAAGGNATVGAVTLNGSTINIQNTGSQALYEAIGFASTVTVTGTASAITSLGGTFEGANLGIGNPVAAGYQTTFTVGNTVGGTAAAGTAPDLTIGAPLVNGNNNAAAVATGLIKAGPGILELTATSTYTGATTISAGGLELGNGTLGGDGTITTTSTITNNGTLIYNRFGSLTSAVPITGTGSVVKTGPGSQTLTSTGDSYSGGTTVNQGTLIVSGALSGNGAVNVTGGTLGGGGSITGAVTVSSGATLDPGVGLSTAGTKLTLGAGLTFGSGANLTLNLDDTAIATDSLAIAGGLTLDPGDTDTLTLNLLNVPATVTPQTYILATYSSSGPIGSARFGSIIQSGGSLNGYVSYDVPGAAGTDELTFTVVPEPGTWGSLIGGLGILVAFQYGRRRRRS